MWRMLLSLPDPSSLKPDDLVEVFSTEKAGDLAAAQSMLEAQGIEHSIAGFEATYQETVMVRRDDLNEAKVALNSLLKIAHREQHRTGDQSLMMAVVFDILIFGFFVVLLVMAALGIRWP
jgi:hypothetical protein